MSAGDSLSALQAAWDAQPDLPPIDFTEAEAAALAAALTSNQVAGEWRDIASAPRDGTLFIATNVAWKHHLMIVGFDAERGEKWPWRAATGGTYAPHQFTHWLPLPASPTPPVRGGE